MMQFTTTVLFLLGTFYGDPMNAKTYTVQKEMNASPSVAVMQPLTLEEYVRDYFADTPVLAEIARCESRFRHIGQDGRVIRGELSAEDVGVMQISEFYHEERAKILGFNLHTLDGNLAYARWLYGKEGTLPWSSSSRCWQRADTLAKTSTKAVNTN